MSAFSDQEFADRAVQRDKFTLLILGDSLSAAYGLKAEQGWVYLLKEQWSNDNINGDVINAAISGETTDGGLARLPRLLTQHEPTHVLIELGGNDGLQGHAVKKIKRNLVTIIDVIKHSGAVPIMQEIQIPTNYGRRYTNMFSTMYSEVAEAHDVVLIPFFLENIALNEDLMQSDGIHPNAKAQPTIAEYMHEQLNTVLHSDMTQ